MFTSRAISHFCDVMDEQIATSGQSPSEIMGCIGMRVSSAFAVYTAAASMVELDVLLSFDSKFI